MVTSDETYHDRGIPIRILGKTWRCWRIMELRAILMHYQGEQPPDLAKIDLLLGLYITLIQYGLEQHDAAGIIQVSEIGNPLSPPRPVFHRAVLSGEQSKFLEADSRLFPYLEKCAIRSPITQGSAGTFPSIQMTPITSFISTLFAFSPRTCAVCFGKLGKKNRIDRHPSLECKHEAEVCHSCLVTSMTVQFNNRYGIRLTAHAAAHE